MFEEYLAEQHAVNEKTVEEIAELLGVITRGLRRRMEAHDRSGLTIPQLMALRLVTCHPGLTLTDLSRKMGLANSTVSGIVDRLEREGLLLRVPDARDRRVCRVNPTPAAEAHREKYLAARRAALSEVLAGLAPGEVSALRQSLAALARVIEPEK
ncbi:MAG: MarR family transcriptional regulator [Bacillota bacterium]|nr:MarR family transcriptional regulator [Bacillota bacterium]